MRVQTTLGEVLREGNDWDSFCNEFHWNPWAVNEGGGDTQVCLTLEAAEKYGLLKCRLTNDS